MGKKLIDSVAEMKASFLELNSSPNQGKVASKSLSDLSILVDECCEFVNSMKMEGINSVCGHPNELFDVGSILVSFRNEIESTPIAQVVNPEALPKAVTSRATGAKTAEASLPRSKAMTPVLQSIKDLFLSVIDWLLSVLKDYTPDQKVEPESESTEDSDKVVKEDSHKGRKKRPKSHSKEEKDEKAEE